MTTESFNRAKNLFARIDSCTVKLREIDQMIEDCGQTAYSNDEVNVQEYNGFGKNHSAYIDRLLVKNMLVGAKDHYQSIIQQCSDELARL